MTMNTDTPETDDATLRAMDIEGCGEFDAVHVQVAKRLERERDDARKQLRKAQVENDHNWQAIEMYEAERALADRLALALKMTRWDSPVTCKKAFDAWKEERGLD